MKIQRFVFLAAVIACSSLNPVMGEVWSDCGLPANSLVPVFVRPEAKDVGIYLWCKDAHAKISRVVELRAKSSLQNLKGRRVVFRLNNDGSVLDAVPYGPYIDTSAAGQIIDILKGDNYRSSNTA